MDADIFVSGKKKLRIQKCPDTCGRGLRVHPKSYVWILVGPNFKSYCFIYEGFRKLMFCFTQVNSKNTCQSSTVMSESYSSLFHNLATRFNLATPENQYTFNLFFTSRLEKPQVSLNWVDYYNANKHLY